MSSDWLSTAYAVGNVVSSVTLVLLNKRVFAAGFIYPMTLSCFHFVFTIFFYQLLAACRFFSWPAIDMPQIEKFKVAGASFASIGFMNLSLTYNSVGFYQITKLMIIPVTLVINFYFYSVSTTPKVKLSLMILLAGVGVATVTDVQLKRVLLRSSNTPYGWTSLLLTRRSAPYRNSDRADVWLLRGRDDGHVPDMAGHEAKGLWAVGDAAAERHRPLAVGAGARRRRVDRVLLLRAEAVRHGNRLLQCVVRPGAHAHAVACAGHVLPRAARQLLLVWADRPNEPDHVPGGGPPENVPRARGRLRALPQQAAGHAAAVQQHRRRDGAAFRTRKTKGRPRVACDRPLPARPPPPQVAFVGCVLYGHVKYAAGQGKDDCLDTCCPGCVVGVLDPTKHSEEAKIELQGLTVSSPKS